ncbi:hypothetical protein D1114_07225 [Cereibacter sphaeroides]|uniref:Uncharacterized protein n=1 Tax=Cereibacter sphaeroides TaxID=1063 RepID=A0AAX1UMV4_CERSP|nr:hypothetical protein [Cereibacter sphaeroides]RHZ96493.1 hypothetical protein D1114_07225 [Cereibacter sphaeroides]
MTEQTTGTALALPEPTALATMFRADGGLDPIIARIEAEARSHAPDLTTVKGRKAIASLAYKIAQSKTALDEAGKALNEEARRQINAVDAERRKARERLDALKDEIRAPLTKWEADEDARVSGLKDRLHRLGNASPNEDTSGDYLALIARVEAAAIDDSWQEFAADAARAKDATLDRLRKGLAQAEQRETQEAELARLRAEAAAREEAERQRIAAEEAERARIAAEKAEAERLARIEREKQEAAERAAKEAEARAAAEAARIQREAEEREAALKRAAAEAEERHRREMEEAKRREETAAQAERDRIEAQRRAEEAARQKREADAAHRARIRDDIATSMNGFTDEAAARLIADAILDGAIPHVKAVL